MGFVFALICSHLAVAVLAFLAGFRIGDYH